MSAPENKSPDTDDKSFNQADKKLLYITFLGGFAANIGVVLIVAAAIATDRVDFSPSRPHPVWVGLILIIPVWACVGATFTAIATI